uniref:ATP synthase CF0 B subunit n=1 Tax=Neotessella volvocina TaxID=52559 RepID=A0A3G2QZR5_9STRA|nr:ATP synthase CF0 B subunit [Neotessella volvocina]
MIETLFSFFLNNEEPFIEFNLNILETNLVNIIILIALLLYGNKISFSVTLAARQQQILQTIENAQEDVKSALNFYNTAESGFKQSLFWLQSWKSIYEKDKISIVNNKYFIVKSALLETFQTTENLVKNFENKAFVSLQRAIISIVAGRIVRKFFSLSNDEKAKLIEITVNKLGEIKT